MAGHDWDPDHPVLQPRTEEEWNRLVVEGRVRELENEQEDGRGGWQRTMSRRMAKEQVKQEMENERKEAQRVAGESGAAGAGRSDDNEWETLSGWGGSPSEQQQQSSSSHT